MQERPENHTQVPLQIPQSRIPTPISRVSTPISRIPTPFFQTPTPTPPPAYNPNFDNQNSAGRVPHDVDFLPTSIPGSLYPPVNNYEAPVIPPAFADGDPSCVRIAYLKAILNNVASKMSIRHANDNLSMDMDMLDAAGVLPDDPIPVRTLASAKRRLGIEPDDHIINYAICPLCWKHFTPQEILDLPSPDCLNPDCSGRVYTEKRDANGQVKRHLIKIIPQVSLIQSLRRMVRRKGFRKLIRDSRNTTADENEDEDFLMEDMYHGKIWHELKTSVQREVGEFGAVRDASFDNRSEQKLTEKRFGLHLVVNLDWFGALSNRPHSSGPMYISIADLPRQYRFMQPYIICLMITPGPNEPTNEQLNHCMEPMARELCALKNGIPMEMYDENDENIIDEEIYADFVCNNCDTPGARKLAGFAGHSADMHPCPWCRCTILDVNKPNGYDIHHFRLRDDFEALKHKFASKDTSVQRQGEILSRHGVRFSTLDWIPGWRPLRQTALDFMHCVFLGIVAYLFTTILFAAHMFYGQGPNSGRARFENAINNIKWPSHITRLPKNLGENQSLKKADEWRRLITVTPVLLWLAWREHNDIIPDTEPPLAPNETIKTNHSRKRKSLYDVIILLCVAIRFLSTKKISMRQANAGMIYLSNYCRGLLLLGASLTINHHLAMHYTEMIKIYGPVYAWWLFAFERFNGMLEKVKVNGHDGGRIELTMMRYWVQAHLIYEYLLGLPSDASEHERNLVNKIINAEAENQRGAMMTEIAIFQSEASTDSCSLPRRLSKNPLDLHTYRPQSVDTDLDLYSLLYEFYRTLWLDLDLQPEFSLNPGLPFLSSKVARRLTYIRKDGLRYGCTSNVQTQADSMAFILHGETRVPIQIVDLFVVNIHNSGKPPHVCALVRRLRINDDIPPLPWDTFASVLGIHVAYANMFQAYEVISAASIDSPLALIQAEHFSTRQELWIAISFDHVYTFLLSTLLRTNIWLRLVLSLKKHMETTISSRRHQPLLFPYSFSSSFHRLHLIPPFVCSSSLL
ncbi:hypothetical protein K435DRAFT_649850 [Dendrothele bispora CBS 962.96]|uniref:Uncharacterized protein n=1 Tax=Dendrothele bispora (strain CBS 962.96) TaxID=1314807 RepID=A0A4V6T5N3_DENBC|nr:hypothetical protein K435DRAFT_649850 [Dendrothele bispora CBS 962.96]